MKYSPFTALKYRDFRYLWIGFLISRIGSEMQVVAVNWQIYLITGSPLSLGLIGLSRFLPIIFFSLLGGLAADIIERRKIMLWAQVVMIVCALFLGLATFTNQISPLLIYLLIGISSAASAFDTPARQSLVPLLVPKEHFTNAVSLNTIMWNTGLVLGPAVGGFVIALLGIKEVYFINALSFVGVVLALLFMQPTPQKVSSLASFNLESIKSGFSFVFRTPIIYSTMILDFLATFFSSATVLMPIFAQEILDVGPTGLGILYAASSLGAISGGIATSSLGHLPHQGKILLASIALYGLATILFGLSTSFYLSLIFLALSGIGDVISTVIRNTIRQLSTPDHLRGRMVSINMIFFMGGPQLGELEAGVLAATVGAPASVVIGGVGTILAVIRMAKLVPKLKNYQGNELITA